MTPSAPQSPDQACTRGNDEDDYLVIVYFLDIRIKSNDEHYFFLHLLALCRCKFPFRWNGLDHSACAHMFTPSHADAECKALRETLPDSSSSSSTMTRYKVLDEDGEEVTTCYGEMPGKYGWWVRLK